MNMTSRYSLLLAATALISVACSAPADGTNGPPPPPGGGLPPPGFANAQAGTTGLPEGTAGSGGAPVSQGGAGGAAPVAVAGSGGAPAGGAGGAGGGGSVIPTGTGLAITPTNGWVAGTTNGVGIQGAFYTFSDAAGTPPGDTTMTPASFEAAGETICVSGVASQVQGTPPAYGQYWGGGVGLNLAEPGAMMPALPWDRGNVTGFSFNVTGTAIPAAFRFKATFYEGAAINEDYCVGAAAGPNSIRFDQIVNECYVGGLGAPALAPAAQLSAIQWQVATVVEESTPFDFCIENLTALMGP